MAVTAGAAMAVTAGATDEASDLRKPARAAGVVLAAHGERGGARELRPSVARRGAVAERPLCGGSGRRPQRRAKSRGGPGGRAARHRRRTARLPRVHERRVFRAPRAGAARCRRRGSLRAHSGAARARSEPAAADDARGARRRGARRLRRWFRAPARRRSRIELAAKRRLSARHATCRAASRNDPYLADISVAFLEEPPFLTDCLADGSRPTVVLGFFSGRVCTPSRMSRPRLPNGPRMPSTPDRSAPPEIADIIARAVDAAASPPA